MDYQAPVVHSTNSPSRDKLNAFWRKIVCQVICFCYCRDSKLSILCHVFELRICLLAWRECFRWKCMKGSSFLNLVCVKSKVVDTFYLLNLLQDLMHECWRNWRQMTRPITASFLMWCEQFAVTSDVCWMQHFLTLSRSYRIRQATNWLTESFGWIRTGCWYFAVFLLIPFPITKPVNWLTVSLLRCQTGYENERLLWRHLQLNNILQTYLVLIQNWRYHFLSSCWRLLKASSQ